jgi:hypothetical protein
MACALNQQIPHAEDRKARLHQRQQFLVEDQKLADWKASESAEVNRRPAGGDATTLELKDEKSLPLELRPDKRLLVTLHLAFEGRSIRTRNPVREYSHKNFS